MRNTHTLPAAVFRRGVAGRVRAVRALFAVVAVGCLVAFTPPAATAQSGAAASGAIVTVQRLHDALIEVMRNGPELGYTGRYDRLAGEFDELFDVPYISRLLLGAVWKDLTPKQRERFEKLIFQYAAGTFASRFTSYDGESFDVEFEKPLQRTRMQVRGRFTMDDGDKLQLDYALHERSGYWQIVDVYYDGVSGTRIQRNEFVEVIENEGIDALLEQLAGKVVLLEAGAE